MVALQTRKLAALLFIFFIALLGVVFTKNLIDFPVYYAAGESLINGRTDLYAPDFALGRVMDYRYPPIFLVAFLPLWYLPYKIAAFVWYILSILQIAGSLMLLRRVSASPEIPQKVWLILFFSTAQYFVMILHYGNAHLIAIYLLVVSIYFVFIKRDLVAGLFIACAIIIKLTPVLVLLYFAIKKQWKYLALVGAFLIVLTWLPAFYFGFSKNLELHKTWFSHVVINQEFHEVNGPINLSLKGQLRRYFTTVDYRQRVDGDTRYPTFNMLSLSTHTTDVMWILISFIVIGAAAILILKSVRGKRTVIGDGEEGKAYLLEIGIFICVMLFVGPLTSKIYFIALLVPVYALAVQPATSQAFKLSRKILLVIAILNSLLPLLPGRLLQRWFLVLGVDFYVNLLLMAALFYEWVLQYGKPFHRPGVEPQRPAQE